MRFVSEGVCVQMHYRGPMCYVVQFPAHRLGGRSELCVIRGYALSEVCVKRGSTVLIPGIVLATPFPRRDWSQTGWQPKKSGLGCAYKTSSQSNVLPFFHCC